MIRKFISYAMLWMAVATLGACTATSTRQQDVDISAYKYVVFSDSIALFDQKYIPDIARALQRHGLQVVHAPDQAASTLICKLQIDQSSVWNFRVHISLWDGTRTIAVAESVNPGWGTLLARDAAVQALVATATKELETQLRQHPNSDQVQESLHD